jgi:YD repeat-containing protein
LRSRCTKPGILCTACRIPRTIYTATVGGNPEVTSYGYDAANRLANVGGVAYTWDDAGRLLDDGTYQYTWNAAGQLITVTDGINTLGFRYDGDGNRLVRIVNGTLTTHTLDVGLAHLHICPFSHLPVCKSYDR